MIASEHYPNASAVAKHLSGGDSSRESQLLAYAKSCVVPAFSYITSKFGNDLKPAMLAFKAARYFSPHKHNEIKATAAEPDSLPAIPFLNSTAIIDGLKSELPCYLATADDVSVATD